MKSSIPVYTDYVAFSIFIVFSDRPKVNTTNLLYTTFSIFFILPSFYSSSFVVLSFVFSSFFWFFLFFVFLFLWLNECISSSIILALAYFCNQMQYFIFDIIYTKEMDDNISILACKLLSSLLKKANVFSYSNMNRILFSSCLVIFFFFMILEGFLFVVVVLLFGLLCFVLLVSIDVFPQSIAIP